MVLLSGWLTSEIQGVSLPFVTETTEVPEVKEKVTPQAALTFPEISEDQQIIAGNNFDNVPTHYLTAAQGGQGSISYTLKALEDGEYNGSLPSLIFNPSSLKVYSNKEDLPFQLTELQLTATDELNNTASQIYYFRIVPYSASFQSDSLVSDLTVKKNEPFSTQLPYIENPYPSYPWGYQESEILLYHNDTLITDPTIFGLPTEDFYVQASKYILLTEPPHFFEGKISVSGSYLVNVYGRLLGNSNKAYSFYNITVLENSYPAFTTSQDTIDLIAGFATESYVLSDTTDGDGDIDYSLALANGSSLPSGLIFDSTSLELSITESGLSENSYQLLYSAVDEDNDTQSQSFTISVINNPISFIDIVNSGFFIDEATSEIALHPGKSLDSLDLFSLNASQLGDAPLTYSLVGGSNVAGLTINATTGILSGTVLQSFTETTVQIKVTDANNDTSLSPIVYFVSEALTPSFAVDATIQDIECTQTKCLMSVELPVLAIEGNLNSTYSLSLSNGTDLVDGLEFSTQENTLMISDVSYGNYSLLYSVADGDGETANLSFDITVIKNYEVSLQGETYYKNSNNEVPLEAGKAISNLTLFSLDSGDFGNAPVIWELMTDDAIGLSFDNTTGLLSGTVDSGFTNTQFTIKATDADGDSDESTVMFIAEDRTPQLGEVGNINCGELVTSCSLILSEITTPGNIFDTLSLELSGGQALPAGIVFSQSNRLLTISPSNLTANSTYTLNYQAEDIDGSTNIVSFNITITPYQAVNLASVDSIAMVEGEIESYLLPAAQDGIGNYTYSLRLSDGLALPDYLSFSDSSRTLTVSATDVTGIFNMSYTVTDDNGSMASVDFLITIVSNLPVQLQGDEFYVNNAKEIALEPGKYASGILIYSINPSKPGNAPFTWDLTIANDIGLSINASTGVLSGIVNNSFSKTGFQIRVTDTDSDGHQAGLRYFIPEARTPGFGADIDNIECSEVSGSCSFTLPDSTTEGNVHDTLSLSLSGEEELPTGLAFTESSRLLVVTVADLQINSTYNFDYKVEDVDGSSEVRNFNLTFIPYIPPSLAETTDISVIQGETEDFVLPQPQGGIADFTYSLVQSDSLNLPGGLSFVDSTRTLTVDSSSLAEDDTFNLTYSVTDGNNVTATSNFSVTILQDLSPTITGTGFFAVGNNIALEPGSTVTNLSIFKVVNEGNAPTVFTINEGSELLGMTMNATTGYLNGQVDADFTSTGFVIRYSDADGDYHQANTRYFIPEAKNPVFTSEATDLDCYFGTEICSLTLSDASEGNVVNRFSLSLANGSILPDAVSFDSQTLMLSFDPTDLAANTSIDLRYQVTDVDGDSDVSNFTITVIADTTPVLQAVADIEVIFGEDSSVVLPEATFGNEPLTYSLLLSNGSALPDGVTFNSANQNLSINGSALAANLEGTELSLSYLVVDENQDNVSVEFVLSIVEDVSPTIIANDFFVNGSTIALQPGSIVSDLSIFKVVDEGNAPAVFSINDGTELLGMSLDTTTGYLNGLVDTNFNSTSFTIRLTDIDGDVAEDSTYSFVSETKSPSFDTEATDFSCYFGNEACSVQLSNASEGNVVNLFELSLINSSGLPLAFTFDDETFELSFNPSGLSVGDSFALRYLVTDIDGDSDVSDFTVSVVADTIPSLQDAADIQLIYGEDTSVVLPETTLGNAPFNYSLLQSDDNDLPAGLSFEPSNRSLVISGSDVTVDLNGSVVNLTYLVVDNDGDNSSVSFTVTLVADELPIIATEPFYSDGFDIALEPGSAVNALSLFSASSQGNGPAVFSINNGTQLLGLTIDPSTGILSGTVSSNFVNTSVVIELTDIDGDSAVSSEYFFVPEARSPVFETTVDDVSCFFGNEICTVQLSNATSGNIENSYTLTLADGGDLPASVTFDANTLVVSFDPVGLAVDTSFALRYEVTDIDGDSDAENFSVTVIENTDPAFGVVADIAIIVGEIEEFTLATAIGGDGEISYSLLQSDHSGLPDGVLIFSADNLSLQVDASALNGGDIFNLSFTATDADNGTGTALFTVTILADLTPSLEVGSFYSSNGQIALEPGSSINDLVLFSASAFGNLPAKFAINEASELLGLSINASTGVLSGMVDSDFQSTNFTITLTDVDGDVAQSDTYSFISQARTPSFSSEQPALSCIEDQSNCSYVLPQATEQGNIADTYTISLVNGSTLPAQVDFDTTTRTLTVDSAAIETDAVYQIRLQITDSDGSSDAITFSLTLEADSQPVLPAVAAISANVEQLSTINLPAASDGNGPLTYTLSLVGLDELPDGLSFNASSLILSINASLDAANDSYSLLYQVTDNNGDTDSIGVVVSILLDPAPMLSASSQFADVESIALAPGSDVVNLSLVSIDSLGSEPSVFSINNASSFLGLTIDQATGSLSGSLNDGFVDGESYAINISLTDDDGDVSTISKTLLALDKTPAFTSPAANLSCVFNGDSCSFSLSSASEGNIETNYRLTQADNSALPAALSFDTASLSLEFDTSNLLTGTSYSLRYRVEDIDGSESVQLFTVRVSEALSFEVEGQNYLLIDQAISSVSLPSASYGTGSISHSLTGSLPAGLVFDGELLVINGTPTEQGNFTVSLVATDSLNATASIDLVFDIQEQKAPVIAEVSDSSSYGNGTVQIALTSMSEANGDLQFSFQTNGEPGLPGGLFYNPNSGMIEGIATVSGEFNITVTVTDSDNVDDPSDEVQLAFSLMLLAAITLDDSLESAYSSYSFVDAQFQLPAASGGDGSLSYSVQAASDSSLIQGFSFDADSRVYSGRSSQSGTFNLEYVVTDSESNSESFEFQVTLTDLPVPVFASEFSSQELGVGEEFGWDLPKAGPAILTQLTYSLRASPELPAQVSFTSGTRILAGSFDQVGSYNVTYSVSNAANVTVSQVFEIEVTIADVSVALTEDILAHHALAIADSTSRAVKSRMALAGQARIALEENKGKSRSSRLKSANIQSNGLMYSLWTDVYSTSLSQGNAFNWDADVSISQVGFDVSSNEWFAGLASETVSSSIDFDYEDVAGSYALDIGLTTLYAGYKSGQLSFWGASSSGSGGTLDLSLEDSEETVSSELSYSALMGGLSYDLSSSLAVGGDYIFDATLSNDNAEGSAGRLNAYVDWTFASLTNSDGKVWLQPKLNTALRVDSGAAEQTGIDVSLSSLINLSPSFYLDAGLRVLALNFGGDLSESSYWLSAHWQSQSTGFAASLGQRLGSTQFDRNRLFDSRLLSDVESIQSDRLELSGEMSYSWLHSEHSWKLYSTGTASQAPGQLDNNQALISLFGERVGLQWSNPRNRVSLTADYRLHSGVEQSSEGIGRLGQYFDTDATQLELKATIDLP